MGPHQDFGGSPAAEVGRRGGVFKKALCKKNYIPIAAGDRFCFKGGRTRRGVAAAQRRGGGDGGAARRLLSTAHLQFIYLNVHIARTTTHSRAVHAKFAVVI